MSDSRTRYADYLKTDYWIAVSDAVKKRDGYKCRVCNSPHDLQAHHRDYSHRGNELNHLSDLTTLCRRCHEIFHKANTSHSQPTQEQPTASKSVKIEFIMPAMQMTKKQRKAAARQVRQMAQEASRPIPPKLIDHSSFYNHEADMPACFPFTIDKKFMETLKTHRGGYTSATLKAIGVPPKPVKGWPRRCIGVVLTREQCLEALQSRERYNS